MNASKGHVWNDTGGGRVPGTERVPVPRHPTWTGLGSNLTLRDNQ